MKIVWDKEDTSTKIHWDNESVEEQVNPLMQFGKNVVGIGEGAVSLGSQLLGAPAMGLRALGEWALSDADMPTALDRAQSSSDMLKFNPRTDAGKDSESMFSWALDELRSGGGRAMESTVDTASQIPGIIGAPARVLQSMPGAAQTMGEVGVDMAPVPFLRAPKGTKTPIDRSIEPTVPGGIKPIPDESLKEPTTYESRQAELTEGGIKWDPTPIETPRVPDAPYNYQDYVPVTREEFPSLQRDVVPESRRTLTEDVIQPDPERYRSPVQQDASIEFTREVPPKIDLETGQKVRRTKKDWREYRERGPVALGEDAPKADAFGVDYHMDVLSDLNLPTEKLLRNKTVKSMDGRIKEQKEFLDEIGREYSEAYQASLKTRTGNLTQSKAAKETLAAIEAKYRRQEEVLKHMNEALKNKVEEVYGRKGMYDNPLPGEQPVTRNLHPFSRKQGGQINPEVFRQGFHRVKKLADKGISLIARGGPGGLKIEVMNDQGVRLGGSFFDKKTSFSPDFQPGQSLASQQDLFSRGTGITQSEQGRGLATEMYKFASELGNDIVPSTSRSPEGRKMWEGFEKRGLAKDGRIPADSNVPQKLNKGPGGRQHGAVDPSEIGKGLAKLFNKKPKQQSAPSSNPQTPRNMREIKRYLHSDTRDPETFLKEEMPNIRNWEDIGKVYTEVLPASNIGTLAKQNPSIKWVQDRALSHDREARVQKENSKFGAKFAPKRGIASSKFNRRQRSDDGAISAIERMPIKDADSALKLWIDKYDGKDIPMTPETLAADGMSPQQIKALMTAKGKFQKLAEDFNAQAEKSGFNPLPIRPNYFPHMWDGDYRVYAKDANGDTLWVEGVRTEWGAKGVRKELQAKFPEYQIEIKEAGSKYDLDNTDAFRDALSLLSKDDPVRKVLQASFENILDKRGFKKQTIHRQGKPGFLGSSKTGKEGVRDALRGMEMYLDRGYNFLANQKKKSDWANLLQIARKEHKFDYEKELPNSFNYINAFIDNSAGALENKLALIDDVIEGAGSMTGAGRSAARNALSGVNGLASTWWLTTPRFLLAQTVQPLYNLPKGIELKGAGLTKKSVMATFMDSYRETFFSPSADTIAGINWARENGFIDSKILDLMGMKFEGRAKQATSMLQALSKWSLGKWEQEMVRTPSFVFYNKLLKESIPDAKERYKIAGMLTDKYMVDYTATDTPLLYGRMGLLGDAAKPLKQFQHAYFGQALEYLSDVKSEKSAKPLAAFIGVQAAVSGAKGLLLAGEVTAILMALNEAFGLDFESFEEWLTRSDMPRWAVFGPLSTWTGLDMSGTLGAPQIPQLSGLPGVEFSAKATKDVLSLAISKLKGQATEAQEMQALQSVTPNALQGLVEEAYTRKGEGPPVPQINMLPMTSPRNTEDKLARAMGGRSTREAEEMMRNRTYKQAEARLKEQKDKLLDAIVDHAVEGKPIDHLIKKYVEDKHGDPKSIPRAIVKHLKDRARTYAEREVMKKGFNQSQKLQRLQEFNMILDSMEDPDEIHQLIQELNK